MKIAITGSSRLASKFDATSYRTQSIIPFENYDIFINHSQVRWHQIELLDSAVQAWKNDPTKLIINISSRAGLPNLSKNKLYAAQNAALDHMSDNFTYNSDAKCRITTINLGLMESQWPSLTFDEVASVIQYIISLPQHIEIPRIHLQHSHPYQDVQAMKEKHA